MSDHDSFLRLISDEPPPEVASEHLSAETSDSGSDLSQGTPTEWDLNEEQNAVADEVVPAEEAENFGVQQEGWAERAIDSEVNAEEAETHEYSAQTEVSRTENYNQEPNADEVLERKTQVTRTAHYTHEEAASFSSQTEETPTAEARATERSQIQKTQHTKSFRARTQVTGATVPFEGENKTAAFNYDEEEAGSRLVLLEGKANTKAVHLHSFPIRMGRDQANELILDDLNVSRFHAEIQKRDGGLYAVDLGSTNGIKVNGQVVSDHPLQANDIIQVGDCLLEFLPGGMLSKGVPKSNAMQATVSHNIHPKRKKIIRLVSVMLIIAAAGFWLFQNRGSVSQSAIQAAKKAAAQKASDEIQSMRSVMESQFQKRITEVSKEDLKRVFLERLESSSIAGLIPMGLRENLSKLPPVCFKLFLDDPKMVSGLIERGANIPALDYVLRDKLNQLIENRNFGDAYALAEFLLTMNSDDQSLKRAVTALGEHVKSRPPTLSDGGSEGYKNLSPEEKKFYEYVDAYDRNFEQLIAEKRFAPALSFARNVRQKLSELIRVEASFERVARPEIEKWDQRIAQVEAKVKTAKHAEEALAEKKVQAEKLLRDIKLNLDTGDVAVARVKIEEFLKEFAEHPQALEVLQLKRDMELGVERSFSTIRTNVERFLKTESFENAWAELYKFLDMMPAYAPGIELKTLIDQATRPKASQYYNQARVYEYEADDLIAAEQYYKRAMEAADPRSELAKKATRRHAEVKRKLIH